MVAVSSNHNFASVHIGTLCTSVAATPVTVYFRAPFRARIGKVTSIIAGAITSANASCAVTINGGSTSFTHTIVQSGSAAGQLDSTVPGTPTYVAQDDVIAITPSGASGASVQAHFVIALTPA